MRIFIPNITRYLLITVGLCSIGLSGDDNPTSLAKPSTIEFELFEGNNISSWMGNQGHLSSHIPLGNSGFEWPAGSGNTAVFASGIWVLGQIDGDTRSAAAEFTSEWTPGTIPYDTQTQQPTSDTPLNTPDHQFYYIHQDNSSDPSSVHYNREYATWPAADGAPSHDGEYFTDLNGNSVWDSGESFEDFDRNGSYNPPDGQLVTGEDPPLFFGDTQAWYVMNDWYSDSHANLWSTAPLGLEAQVLIYTRSDDPIYENVQFHTITLINKGGQTIENTYYANWMDADLGDATDDYVGCDTTLDLAFTYNGSAIDRDYGLEPPAIGYAILQGPMIASMGDTVWNDDVPFAQHRVLGMTAHSKFHGSSAVFQDPENAFEAFNIMQGWMGWQGEPFYEFLDPSQNTTTFVYSGNPVTRNGWTEFDEAPVGDRRNVISSGPFTMLPWDDSNDNGSPDFEEPGVQVIHAAWIIVDGADHLNAVTNLKYVTKFTHSAFDRQFETYAMETPPLTASSHDQEIILNWFEGADDYEATKIGSYQFEGYNLYQGASATGPWTRLATFDVSNGVGVIYDLEYNEDGYLETRVVQEGDDTSLEHLLVINSNALNDDAPLTNNKAYYFALSAYAYSSEALPKTLESQKQIVSVRPHLSHAGVAPRDTLIVNRPAGGEMFITVEIQDPSQLTGLDYEIGFEYDSSTALGRWHVVRGGIFPADTLFRSEWFEELNTWNSRSGSHYLPPTNYFDGFELSVSDIFFQAPKYKTRWQQTLNVRGDSSWVESYMAVSPGGVDSLLIVNGDTLSLDEFFAPVSRRRFPDYEIREEGIQTWFDIPFEEFHSVFIQGFASKFGAQGGDRLADIPGIGGGSTNLEFLQSDLEVRFTAQGQTASKYDSRTGFIPEMTTVPFEVWDIERDRQLCVAFYDTDTSGSIQDTTHEDWEHTLGWDWVIVFDRDYEVFGSEVDSFFNNPYSGWCWQFNSASKFSVGDVVSIQFLNPVKAGVDMYSWSTEVAATAYDEDALDLIQIFPNPYFGYQQEQSSFSEPYVTLSNLPQQTCTVRIYSLGGSLVRRFDHEVGTYEYWDLLNEHGWPVASGVYIVHIEVPDLGHKILKVAVFQPER